MGYEPCSEFRLLLQVLFLEHLFTKRGRSVCVSGASYLQPTGDDTPEPAHFSAVCGSLGAGL